MVYVIVILLYSILFFITQISIVTVYTFYYYVFYIIVISFYKKIICLWKVDDKFYVFSEFTRLTV